MAVSGASLRAIGVGHYAPCVHHVNIRPGDLAAMCAAGTVRTSNVAERRGRWRNICIAASTEMAELTAPAIAFIGLLIATGLYFRLVRRRGYGRRRRRADEWDREMSQARAVQRFESLQKQDGPRPK